MTDEQWKQYKEAQPHFESAKHNFVRNAPRWLTEQTIRIYEDVTGRTMLYNDLSCAVCVLHIYQTAAKLFDEEQKNRQLIENEKVDNTKPDSRDKEKAPRDNGANKKRHAKVKNNKRASKKA